MKLAIIAAITMVGMWSVVTRADDLAPAGLDPRAFAHLMERARASNTDAIVLMRDGLLLGEWYLQPPHAPDRIEAMSATKSVVALAIGALLDAGKIKSLDQPVSDFYPEWRQGRKRAITIRHLLTQTSGLQNEPNTTVEIYPSPDFVQLALTAELSSDPGAVFAYNNKAVNLLAGIVHKASGRPLDDYVRDTIFAPLGITDITWSHDGAGNPHAMSGLQLRPADLAKIGQLMLDGGVWQGKRILSASWVAEAITASARMENYGLLWWLQHEFKMVLVDDALLATLRSAGDSPEFLRRAATLKDQVFTSRDAAYAALKSAFGGKAGVELWYDSTWRKHLPDGKQMPSPVSGFYADGYLGQYLVVIPAQHLVAVRMMNTPPRSFDRNKLDAFQDFPEVVRTLVAP